MSRGYRHFYEIDAIRIFAAMAVFLFHMTAMSDRVKYFPDIVDVTKYGFLGVPLFFLISGFVIMKTTQNRSAIDFGISRFTRLYPTLWLCSAVTALFLFGVAEAENMITVKQYLANATLFNDYLGIRDIDPVYWTLHLEVQFYVCVGLLMLLGVLKYQKIWLSMWLVLLIAYYFWGEPFFLPWFISPQYSCYFIGGIAIFALEKHRTDIFYWGVLFLSLLLAVANIGYQLEMHTGVKAAVNYNITSMLTMLCYGGFVMVAFGYLRIPGSRALILCGALSYPIYLLHHRVGKELFYLYIDALDPYVLLLFIIFGIVGTCYFIHLLGDKIMAVAIRKRLNQWLRPNT